MCLTQNHFGRKILLSRNSGIFKSLCNVRLFLIIIVQKSSPVAVLRVLSPFLVLAWKEVRPAFRLFDRLLLLSHADVDLPRSILPSLIVRGVGHHFVWGL